MTKNPYRLPTTVVPSAYRLFLEPDLGEFTFSGRVEIDVHVVGRLNGFSLNSLELELSRATVTSHGVERLSGDPVFDPTYQTATFAFDELIPAGNAVLSLRFEGVLNDQLHGFYRSTFTDDDGVVHTLATTQFAPTEARRCFPCWDEPSFKATYEVSLTIPADLTAVSNTRTLSDIDLGDGRRIVSFSPTMKMSTYLVAFVVGAFEATSPVEVRGIPLRVVYPRGKGALATASIEMAEHALEFFSDYFAIPYPGDKLDLVAVPDFAAGAMENLGCITFRETDLLIDLATASHNEVERVALVVDHEIAHMWFGDLVTMDWWEGIWLNEAFATFMETICTDHYRPEWKKWVEFNTSRDVAFGVDGLHSTRPIEYEVVSPNDCRGMFDVLTYIKGCAVLRMLEQYLGAEVFRDGIRLYLARHAYANTVTSDLWDALEESSGEPVARIMNTWILQGGYPLVTVEDGTISQTPFSYLAPQSKSAIGSDWLVPVLSRPLAGGAVVAQLLDSPSASLATPGVAVVNAGGSGFYRTAYGESELADIAANLSTLDEIERAVLFSDTWAAVLVGRVTLSGLLTLATGLKELDEPSAWRVVIQALGMIDRISGEESRSALAGLARRLLLPVWARLGWEPIAGESEQAVQLRSIALEVLGTLARDESVVVAALRRFDAGEVSGDLAVAILNITAIANRPGTAEVFESRRRSATTPQEGQNYLFALSQIPDEDEALALFERCLSDIRNQDAPYLIASQINQRVTGPFVWCTLRDRWDEVMSYFPEGMHAHAVTGVRGLIGDATMAREIRAFHESHPVAASQQTVLQVLDMMDQGVTFGERVRRDLVATLDAIGS